MCGCGIERTRDSIPVTFPPLESVRFDPGHSAVVTRGGPASPPTYNRTYVPREDGGDKLTGLTLSRPEIGSRLVTPRLD